MKKTPKKTGSLRKVEATYEHPHNFMPVGPEYVPVQQKPDDVRRQNCRRVRMFPG